MTARIIPLNQADTRRESFSGFLCRILVLHKWSKFLCKATTGRADDQFKARLAAMASRAIGSLERSFGSRSSAVGTEATIRRVN